MTFLGDARKRPDQTVRYFNVEFGRMVLRLHEVRCELPPLVKAWLHVDKLKLTESQELSLLASRDKSSTAESSSKPALSRTEPCGMVLGAAAEGQASRARDGKGGGNSQSTWPWTPKTKEVAKKMMSPMKVKTMTLLLMKGGAQEHHSAYMAYQGAKARYKEASAKALMPMPWSGKRKRDSDLLSRGVIAQLASVEAIGTKMTFAHCGRRLRVERVETRRSLTNLATPKSAMRLPTCASWLMVGSRATCRLTSWRLSTLHAPSRLLGIPGLNRSTRCLMLWTFPTRSSRRRTASSSVPPGSLNKVSPFVAGLQLRASVVCSEGSHCPMPGAIAFLKSGFVSAWNEIWFGSRNGHFICFGCEEFEDSEEQHRSPSSFSSQFPELPPPAFDGALEDEVWVPTCEVYMTTAADHFEHEGVSSVEGIPATMSSSRFIIFGYDKEEPFGSAEHAEQWRHVEQRSLFYMVETCKSEQRFLDWNWKWVHIRVHVIPRRHSFIQSCFLENSRSKTSRLSFENFERN